jgi:fluoroquinolone transport system permease protein
MKHDAMLAAILFAPILLGIVFRFGIPLLEETLCSYFQVSSVFKPYYRLLDLFVVVMTAYMCSVSGIMVILGDLDCGVTKALVVTPLGKRGYLLSRIGIPSVLAAIYGGVIACMFGLSALSVPLFIALTISASLIAVTASFLVVAIAKNKVEGLALSKLSGLMLLGLPAAYFIREPVRYLTCITPGFWLARLGQTEDFWFLLPIVLTSVLWIALLYRRFSVRVYG